MYLLQVQMPGSVSDAEKEILTSGATSILNELQYPIDSHSNGLIVSHLELLLRYCQRFYDRQFYTRTTYNQDVTDKLNARLREYINSEKLCEQGLPTVKWCADSLNLSQCYLSDLVKKESGKTVQEHIHIHVLDKAKTMLLKSDAKVSSVAYELGFKYPQHFSKLFKLKEGCSPKDYRKPTTPS